MKHKERKGGGAGGGVQDTGGGQGWGQTTGGILAGNQRGTWKVSSSRQMVSQSLCQPAVPRPLIHFCILIHMYRVQA